MPMLAPIPSEGVRQLVRLAHRLGPDGLVQLFRRCNREPENGRRESIEALRPSIFPAPEWDGALWGWPRPPRSDVERSLILILLVGALAAYGVWQAFYAIATLPGPASPLLLLAFAVKAVLAILAAIGVWRQQRWAGAALLLLGATIAATALVEAFVLGVIAWLYALLLAVAAIVIALMLGAYVDRSRPV